MLNVLYNLLCLLCSLEPFLCCLPQLRAVCAVAMLCCLCCTGSLSLGVSVALTCVVMISRITTTYPSIQVPFSGYSQAIYLFIPEYLRLLQWCMIPQSVSWILCAGRDCTLLPETRVCMKNFGSIFAYIT